MLIDAELDSRIGFKKPLKQARFLSFLWYFLDAIGFRVTLHDGLVFHFIFWL